MKLEQKYKSAMDRIKELELGSLPNLRDALPQSPQTAGQIVRALRRNFKITIEEVARVTDIGGTNLSAIENDRIDIGVVRAQKLAAFFGINPMHLLFPNGFSPATEPELRRIAEQGQQLRKAKAATAG